MGTDSFLFYFRRLKGKAEEHTVLEEKRGKAEAYYYQRE
jgi:hypothetical protein